MSDQLNQLYVYKDKTLWGLRYVNSRVKRVGWLNVAFLGTIGFLVSEMFLYFYLRLLITSFFFILMQVEK